MERILFFDCANGVSGDMILGALLDMGVDEKALRKALNSLPCADEFELCIQKQLKYGLSGTSVQVKTIQPVHNHDHEEISRLGYQSMVAQIDGSGLSENVKQKAKDIFLLLAQAESEVHGVGIEELHFHEIGAVDTIVDICGACYALEFLGEPRVMASSVNLGGGRVSFSHGTFGVPAPAVAKIMEGQNVYGDHPDRGELTTPTGAAILRTIGEGFGEMPPMRIEKSGCGFGQRDTGTSNELRVYFGEPNEKKREGEQGIADANTVGKKEQIKTDAEDEPGKEKEEGSKNENILENVVMLETTIDDMTGEALAFAAETFRDAGALEVFSTSIYMKKKPTGCYTFIAMS